MSVSIHQVDAFTDRLFSGNPAAVCLLTEPRDEAWMQNLAAEMNLSETAYPVPRDDGYDLRWFTPAVEVDLCGHATLASAHVLWEVGQLAPDEDARFHTKSGLLTARRDGAWIELDFPAYPPQECAVPPLLLGGLGLEPVWVGRSTDKFLVEIESEQAVRAVAPDFGQLRDLEAGVIVTSRSDDPAFDFVSRFFGPAFGIDEDPVTGSAHCHSGPFWQERLGKSELMARQVSRREGVVRVRLSGDRTLLGGQAVTVFRGELAVPVPATG
ncbi:MAG: PhzF family phenazine biosynthesis protein [Planctomycetota bacterium]|jgi:predicted PhzF superfamily epimerase YddE/YHI9